MEIKTHTKQLPMKKVILLVFTPAILLLLFFVLSAVFLKNFIPVYLCLLLSIVVVIIPFEVAIIAAANKKEYGQLGLKAAFTNHKQLPIWKIILLGLISFAWAGLVFAILQPLENSILINWVFQFVPDYLRSTGFSSQLATFSKPLIALTCVINLIFNGLIAPIVEELYFRGFLMSRMARFGKATPFIVAVLFSVYHLFTPWENLTRIIAFTPLHYIAWKKKNLYIGMLTHCACNLAGAISLFSLLLAK
jgi:uncharacterized protein